MRHHHERWDGTGYPDGLSGEENPLAARIFSVGDTIDAITTDRPYRPYRPAAPLAEARDAVAAKAGTQFDPDAAAVLAEIPDEVLDRIRTGMA